MEIRSLAIVFFLSMIPILELRFSIPYGLAELGLSPLEVFTAGVIGNLFPVLPLMWFLPRFVGFLFKHIPFLHRHIENYFKKIHHKHSKRIDKWGALALAIFHTLPIPGAGVWTATAIAYVFNLKKNYAFAAICAGTILHGILFTFFSDAVVSWWNGR